MYHSLGYVLRVAHKQSPKKNSTIWVCFIVQGKNYNKFYYYRLNMGQVDTHIHVYCNYHSGFILYDGINE